MNRTLVTVVAEAVLERELVEDVKRLGAHGYTIGEVRGEGARGLRAADWEHNRTIRLETIVDAPVAEAIAEHVRARYFKHYAVIVYLSEVRVIRSDKF